jgi:hypothetical protein
MLRPLQFTGSCDIDVETLHLFVIDDDNIAFSFITRTGATNVFAAQAVGPRVERGIDLAAAAITREGRGVNVDTKIKNV